jgi:hypothetical protein
MGRGLANGLPCQAPSEGAPQSAARGTLRSRDRAVAGMSRPRQAPAGAFASRCGDASSSGRDCSALRGATQSVARGALRSGDRAAAGMPRPRQNIVGSLTARYGVASSSGRHCSALRGATRSVARGALRSGDRAAAGMPRPRQNIVGSLTARYGSHLPLEDTAPPFAVYSRRRLSRIPSRKAAVAPTEIRSALP